MTSDPYSPLPVRAPTWVNSYSEWRARRCEKFSARHGHRLPRWHNRRGARRLVVLQGVAVTLLLVASVLAFVTDWFFIPFVLGVAGALYCQFALRIVGGSVADTPAVALDEIQLAQRNAARSVGFGVLVALMFVPYFVLIVLSIIYTQSSVPRDYVYGSAILLVSLILLGGCLPTALTAWWLADPEPDDSTAAEVGEARP